MLPERPANQKAQDNEMVRSVMWLSLLEAWYLLLGPTMVNFHQQTSTNLPPWVAQAQLGCLKPFASTSHFTSHQHKMPVVNMTHSKSAMLKGWGVFFHVVSRSCPTFDTQKEGALGQSHAFFLLWHPIAALRNRREEKPPVAETRSFNPPPSGW